MNYYVVEVEEILKRRVAVKAASINEAEAKILDGCEKGHIILDSYDFAGRKIKTVKHFSEHPKCPHCGKPIIPSNTSYTWECNECDEGFFDFEVE